MVLLLKQNWFEEFVNILFTHSRHRGNFYVLEIAVLRLIKLWSYSKRLFFSMLEDTALRRKWNHDKSVILIDMYTYISITY